MPTSSDTAVIKHPVTLAQSTEVASVRIDGGGITLAETALPDAGIVLTTPIIEYMARIQDPALVRMDGGRIATVPCISCAVTSGAVTGTIRQDDARTVIIDDPGPVGITSRMEDMTPEGYAPAWSRRAGCGVRYLTVTVHIRADRIGIVGMLMRMADGPYQVLCVTETAVIKGYIEQMAPVADQGREYITYRLTIAEGRRWTT